MTSNNPDTLVKRDELLALADRCEQATGPDRELDCDIGLMVGTVTLAAGYEPRQVFGRTFSTFTGPRYTASLDAAMTLVPGGWNAAMFSKRDRQARAWCELPQKAPFAPADWRVEHGRAVTMCLALCAASLRSLANKETGK